MLKKNLIALAVAAGLAVWSGPTFAQKSDPALVAKAEKEGSVMFYSTAPEFVLERMKTAFEKKYPKIESGICSARRAIGIRGVETVPAGKIPSSKRF